MLDIKGKIGRVIYYSPTNNWGVFSLKDHDLKDNELLSGDSIVCSGNFEGVYPDCSISIKGELKKHPKYGYQVELQHYKILKDTTSKESIINFLIKSSIRGINVANAVKIFNTFGDTSIDIVLNHPEKLIDIKGIGESTISRVKKSVNTYKDMQELVEYCADLGFNYNTTSKIYKALGETALPLIKKNIYSILDVVDSVSFKQIDSIALKNGIASDDDNRVRYCFLYILKVNTTYEGSTGCKYKNLREKVLKELGLSSPNAFSAMLNVLEEEELIYLENNKVYYKYYYDLERNIADTVINIINRTSKGLKIQYDAAISPDSIISEEITNFPFELNNGQIQAIKNISESEISILTGSAGTGKSTILKALVNIYDRCGYNIVLLSPTGKATRRIEECVGKQAFTVHKFLKVKNSVEETEVEKMPKRSIVFVDESSMLDIIIFNKLLESFNDDTKLVLIGDNKQLPSVQAGNVLEDLMLCSKISVNVLTDIMRQAKDSNIIANCARINEGEIFNQCKHSDFYYRVHSTSDALIKNFMSLYDSELQKGTKSINDIQVITPYKKGTVGTHSLNKLISEKYNANILDERFGFKINDKVMQTRNNYNKEVFNGETGIIKEVVEDIEDDYLVVDFNGKLVQYAQDEVDELVLAFSSTIHKVQGSEYKTVFVLLDDANTMLLFRKILYTAVSRAKKRVYLLAVNNSANKCISNVFDCARTTKLGSFLSKV